MEELASGTVVVDASFVAHPLLDVTGLVLRAHAAMLHERLDIYTVHPRGMRVPQIDCEEHLDVARAVERHGWRAAWVLLPSVAFGRRGRDRGDAIIAAAGAPHTPAVLVTVTPVSTPLPARIHTLQLDLAQESPHDMLDRAIAALGERVEEQPW